MKKLLFVLTVFLYSFDLLGQEEGFDLKDKYDSIPVSEWNYRFVKVINSEFDSLVKRRVDSIMLYYNPVLTNNFALIVFKTKKQFGSIAFYEYISGETRLGSEILNSPVLDSTNIFAFYSIFKDKVSRTLDTNFIPYHLYPEYGKFYFGKCTEIYAAYSARQDIEFKKAFMKEEGRILDREKEIYKSKNK